MGRRVILSGWQCCQPIASKKCRAATWSWNGQGTALRARVEPGKACIVVRNGQTTYLDNEFEVSDTAFTSFDRGRDPQTDEHLWGSVAGAFEFARRASFADEVKVP